MAGTKRVWLFEEGNATMRDELGGKVLPNRTLLRTIKRKALYAAPTFYKPRIAYKGEEIYAAVLRDALEKDCFGQVVIISIETGKYLRLVPTLWPRTVAPLPRTLARQSTASGLDFPLWKA